MNRVFVSYAHDDDNEADGLRRLLVDSGHALWVDGAELRGGADWKVRARDAIIDADAVILLVSPQSLRSEAVAYERSEAELRRKTVIPVIIRPVETPIPGLDPNIVYRDLRDRSANNPQFARLVGDLNALWSDVRNRLAGLSPDRRGGEAPDELRPVINQVQQALAAAGPSVRPPEVFQAFVDLIRRLSADVRTGRRRLDQMLLESLEGQYPQDVDWPFRIVVTEHIDFFRRLLEPLASALSQDTTQFVPVVLLVMTASEAQDLESGAAFDEHPGGLRDGFDRIRTELDQRLAADWPSQYQARPEDWSPYASATDRPTLADLLRAKLSELGDHPKRLVPQFIDIRTLNEPPKRMLLRELRKAGCVIVMDLLSICHPAIHDAYRRSLLDSYGGTLLVQISSFGAFPELSELTLTIRQRLDLEFWNRYALDKDEKCHQVSNRTQLERVIVIEVPKILPSTRQPRQDTIHGFIRG